MIRVKLPDLVIHRAYGMRPSLFIYEQKGAVKWQSNIILDIIYVMAVFVHRNG